MTAILDTSRSAAGDGWKGKSQSVPLRIRLTKEPPRLEAQQEAKKLLLMAFYHYLRGDSKQSMVDINELLRKRPNDIGGMRFKADLLTLEGKTEQALALYDRALDEFYRLNPKPVLLLQARNALMDRMVRAEQPLGEGDKARRDGR